MTAEESIAQKTIEADPRFYKVDDSPRYGIVNLDTTSNATPVDIYLDGLLITEPYCVVSVMDKSGSVKLVDKWSFADNVMDANILVTYGRRYHRVEFSSLFTPAKLKEVVESELDNIYSIATDVIDQYNKLCAKIMINKIKKL